MLLAQVVLGAALTALGASESSHILITVFGAMNVSNPEDLYWVA